MNGEIVVFVATQPMRIAQQGGELLRNRLDVSLFGEAQLDLNIGSCLIALNAAHSVKRHNHEIVLAKPHEIAFGLEQANHL